MSTETARFDAEKLAAINVRRMGLRIALAVAIGFTWSVLSGSVLPFLGPLLAAQFLASSFRPMPLKKALGMAIVILGSGVVLQFMATLMGDRPFVLLMLIGLVYFTCFYLQACKVGGAAIFLVLVLVVAVIVPLMTVLNRNLGASILAILVQGVVSGTLLMWLAHALIPNRGGHDADEAVVAAPQQRALGYAAANTVILLIALAACLTNDQLATAAVIPITVASILSQMDFDSSAHTALGLAMINLIGGIVASVSFVVLEIRPTPVVLFFIVLLVGLVFGGRAALQHPSAKLYAGALTIFLIVFGTGVSPLPGSAAETFVTRVSYIFMAIAYTMFMVALLWPRRAWGIDATMPLPREQPSTR